MACQNSQMLKIVDMSLKITDFFLSQPDLPGA